MLAIERAGRLATKVAALVQLADEAIGEAKALNTVEVGEEADRWLPGLRDALDRIQLEAADAQFAARALREAIPGSGTLQPRLL